ncbi:hypothetical protein BJ878DRAFT_459683 [Calycina marina]|uniref:Transcriptional activator of proteases prtT n=1 Tax=Calycina marina TaxID=1763456 RepID=A0A9P7Z3R7_9HELO|nr:hypothetical protein BJ878DRAFT_459683 [Calycina marina]
MSQNGKGLPNEETGTQAVADSTRPKKRRRVLACETCRRIKSRCDFDVNAGACNRCKTLRITCSLTGSELVGNASQASRSDFPPSDPNMIHELQRKISEQTVLLKDIKRIVEGGQNSKATHKPRFETNSASSVQNDDQGSTKSPADQNTENAPVVVIRNTLRRAHGGHERLTDYGIIGFVACGFFSYEVVLDFLNIFLSRCGPWIQETTWESMGLDSNPDSMSSLLIASCCFQGVRLSQFRNTPIHIQLYEHIRRELAQLSLISPLPMDYLQCLAIMTLWNMAPISPSMKPEFIDSWLLSGHCVQQAMLAINFTEILSSVKYGKTNGRNQIGLRLWNNICLAHLCFATGTGRPSVIADAYLDQCSSVLNFFDATIQDGIVVAEIHFHSTLLKVLKASRPMPTSGNPKELTQWNDKWGYLLELNSDRALMFRMSYHLGYLIISQRSLKNIISASNSRVNTPVDQNGPRSPVSTDKERARYTHLSIDHSTKLLETIIRLPPLVAEAMPDHLVLSYVYAIIILTTCYDDSTNKSYTMKIIQEALGFCRNAGLTPNAPAEFAVAKLEHRLNGQVDAEVSAKLAQGQEQVYQEPLSAFSSLAFSDLEFPSLEDLFGGAFMTGAYGEDLNL